MNTRLGRRGSHRGAAVAAIRELGARSTKREFLIDGQRDETDGGLRRPVHYKLCLLVKPVVPRLQLNTAR